MLLMFGASLSIAVSVVLADPNSGNPDGASDLTRRGSGASTRAQSNSPTIAFARSRARFEPVPGTRQLRMSKASPLLGAPLDARSGVSEPRECDARQGIHTSCIFN